MINYFNTKQKRNMKIMEFKNHNIIICHKNTIKQEILNNNNSNILKRKLTITMKSNKKIESNKGILLIIEKENNVI